jgi:flagellar hook-length control protein FliK
VPGVPASPAAGRSVPAETFEPTAATKVEPVAAPAAPVVEEAPAPLPGHVAPHRAAPLHRAPAAVATLLHVAAERGITRARMALRPADLGGIEIRLQSSAAGIAAQVLADSPEAARLLAQAGDDLRRALEARDVTLLSLEVSTSAEHHQRESARGERPSDDRTSAPTGSGHASTEPEPTTANSVIELPGGLLVDVLA